MLPDLTAQLQPIHTGHTDISQNDIGKPPETVITLQASSLSQAVSISRNARNLR